MAIDSSPFLVPIGSPLPDVVLPDLTGEDIALSALARGKPTLIFFSCNHCPYVRHVEAALGGLISEFDGRLQVLAISSNDVNQYPDDDVAGLTEQTRRAGWHFPYLVDTDQSAAKAFRAACTPDFFVYDSAGKLAYRGAFDASTPKNGEPLTGDLLRQALTCVVAGEPVPLPHRPALGCGIKWRPGNEPAVIVS